MIVENIRDFKENRCESKTLDKQRSLTSLSLSLS
jgi:hypothetical protein